MVIVFPFSISLVSFKDNLNVLGLVVRYLKNFFFVSRIYFVSSDVFLV